MGRRVYFFFNSGISGGSAGSSWDQVINGTWIKNVFFKFRILEREYENSKGSCLSFNFANFPKEKVIFLLHKLENSEADYHWDLRFHNSERREKIRWFKSVPRLEKKYKYTQQIIYRDYLFDTCFKTYYYWALKSPLMST